MPEENSPRSARENALNLATLTSIFIVVIFAVVTQILAATGAISLSTTLQLTMWLVALGFIVLLAIAYMFFLAYEAGDKAEAKRLYEARAAKDLAERQLKDAQDEIFRLRQAAKRPTETGTGKIPTDAPISNGGRGSGVRDENAWMPPVKYRYLDGKEHPAVNTKDVFPKGCLLELEPFRPAPDGNTDGKPLPDVLTSENMRHFRVIDPNPSLSSGAHDTVVNIPADRMPAEFTSWQEHALLEFDELKVITYETDSPLRMGYTLLADGVRLASPTA